LAKVKVVGLRHHLRALQLRAGCDEAVQDPGLL